MRKSRGMFVFITLLFFLSFGGCYTRLTVVDADEPDVAVLSTETSTVLIYDDPFWYPRLGFHYYYPSPDYWYPEWWYYRPIHRHFWWYGWYYPQPHDYWWNHHTLSTNPVRPHGIRRFGTTRESPLGNPRGNLRESPREKEPEAPTRLRERRNGRVAPKPDTPPRREKRVTPPPQRPKEERRPSGIKPNRSPQRPRPETVHPTDKPRNRNDAGTRRPDSTTRKRPRL